MTMFRSQCCRTIRSWRRWNHPAILIFLLFIFVDFIDHLLVPQPQTRSPPPERSVKDENSRTDRIFIASMHMNNEQILRSHWNEVVVDLVKYLGPKNVYISVLESGSLDNSKGALRDLDEKLEGLGVERNIELSDTTHKDLLMRNSTADHSGWVWTSRKKREMRRIPYLAGIRNRVMEKLSTLAVGRDGKEKRYFDKILWLNDVIFTVEDIMTLLETRNGSYAAACSLDFSKPPQYYDTFALRDISGAKTTSHIYPYFLDSKSRKAMISHSPIPVKSCWNGIVVFQAAPFYKDLKFRGLPDSLASHHLEASECCLVHQDNPLSITDGVWLNPNVRVAYSAEAYSEVNPPSGIWPSKIVQWVGIWRNRVARWGGFPRRMSEKYIVNRRLQKWRTESVVNPGLDEFSSHCIINEMQVLVEHGWAHI